MSRRVGDGGDRRGRFASALWRTLFLAALWLTLAEGDLSGWWFGAPVVLLAVYLSLRLLPPVRLKPLALLRFFPLFVWLSITGAWDVALRALRPSRPLRPALADFETRLADGLPRSFFANTVSLLPGTLSADLRGSTVVVHLLDDSPAVRESLATLEQAVARLFGVGEPR